MKTARVDLHLEPELLAAMEQARGDVPRQRWVTRAIEERLRADGVELDLKAEPADVVPIRPGLKGKQRPRKAQAGEKRERTRPTGTWRR